MKFLLETVSCNLCGSSRTQPELEVQDWLHGSGETFHLVRCCNCGLVYLNPRPDRANIDRYYNERGYYAYQLVDENNILVGSRHMRLASRLTKTLTQAGAMLDVGCGNGSFLWAMQRQGWRVAGVELHVLTAERLRRHGLTVFAGNFGELNLPERSYDLITMLEVLEHLHDPIGALRQAYNLIRPGGRLFITVPNIGSLEYHLFKAGWVALEPPLHLYHFNPLTLRIMLEQVGFTVDRVATTSSVAGLTRSPWLALRRKFDQGASGTWGRVYLHRSWRRTVHGLLNWMLAPVGFALSAVGKGPGLEAMSHRS